MHVRVALGDWESTRLIHASSLTHELRSAGLCGDERQFREKADTTSNFEKQVINKRVGFLFRYFIEMS
jgi:hypothetical protein